MSGHNSARWLEVRWLEQAGGRGCHPIIAGWYVVRTCRCHKDEPVTMPLPSEERARSAMRAMLAASEVLGI